MSLSLHQIWRTRCYRGSLRRRMSIRDCRAVRREMASAGAKGLMSFRGKVDPQVQEDILFVRKTLGLDPSAGDIRVVYGSVAKDDKELALLTRSILEIIIDLGSYIDVPAVHVEEKRVNPTMPEETVQGIPVPPLMRIHSSADKPKDAFIAVPYRNYWFWIDDRDLRSKSLFSFLMFVFSLTETGGAKEGAPIITVPSG